MIITPTMSKCIGRNDLYLLGTGVRTLFIPLAARQVGFQR